MAKLDGFKTTELGVFTEVLYKYLHLYYSENYRIEPDYCLSVDIVNSNEVKYTKILNEEIPSLLDTTLDEIKTML